MRFRLYGPTHQHSSFARITRGFAQGLADLGKEVSIYSTSADRSDGDCDHEDAIGADAEVAVHFGAPHTARLMSERGKHAMRFSMLAPNSNVIPSWVLREIARGDASILTPSRWGQRQIHEYGYKATVVRHGLLWEFAPGPADRTTVVHGAPPRLLHVTSTALDRKGTRALLAIWCGLGEETRRGASLTVHCPADVAPAIVGILDDLLATPEEADSVRIDTSPYENMAAYYRTFSHVVQPSRAEGFGLVPLEAAAAGVPCMATLETGSAEYAGVATNLAARLWEIDVRRPHGGTGLVLSDLDDGPGAIAPEIDGESLRRRLLAAVDPRASSNAEPRLSPLGIREEIYAAWRWRTVLRPWVESLA